MTEEPKPGVDPATERMRQLQTSSDLSAIRNALETIRTLMIAYIVVEIVLFIAHKM